MDLRWFQKNKNQSPDSESSQLNFDILPNLLTIEQVSEILGVHPNTLRNWDRSGKLKAVRIGSRQDRRYPKEEIHKLYHATLEHNHPEPSISEPTDDNKYVLKPGFSRSWFKLYFLSRKFSLFVFSVLLVSFTFAVMQVSFFAYVYLARAEESQTATMAITPLTAEGWEYSAQALAIDLLPSAPLGDFTNDIAAHYHQLPDVDPSEPVSIEHTVELEDQLVQIEEETIAPLNEADTAITVSDFSVAADIDPDSSILSSSLRVSFGAAGVPDSEDVLVFEYSLDNGHVWQTLESIPLTDDLSNEIHEGYWEYPISELTDLTLVPKLVFRMTYVEGAMVTGSTAWLDGVVLDLVTQKPDPIVQEIQDSASFIDMGNGGNFGIDERPVVAVETKQDSAFKFLGVKSITREITDVTITQPDGTITDARVDIAESTAGKTTTTAVTVDTAAFDQPGKYAVNLTVAQDGRTEEVAYDFTWGEIAVNPLQNPYRPGDRAQFSIGLVDDTGDVVCDADLIMHITDPQGTTSTLSTEAGTITQSDNCYLKEAYRGPDYLAEQLVDVAGNYKVVLEAQYRGEARIYQTAFSVVDTPKYTVTRDGPTRVYPNVYQPMTLAVTARDDFSGTIRELVPGEFEDVIPDNGGVVKPYDTGTVIAWSIEWDVSIHAGETVTVSYQFKAIQKAPALYFLGPLSVGEWQEPRQWQLVIDATYLYLLANTGSGVASGWVLDSGSDGNFLRAASTAGGTGGNATHTHTFTETVGAGTPTAVTGCASRCASASSGTHTHTSTGTSIATANNNPAQHTFYLWKYNTADATPPNIPDNTFILFDNVSGQPTSPWSRFSAADNRLIRINNSHTTGGSDTHDHTITWGSLNAASGTGLAAPGLITVYATSTHTHTAPGTPTTTDSTTSLPEYSTFELYEQTSATPQSIPTGTVALFDGTPPAGWTVISNGSPSQNRFVRGSATAGSTGGSATSSHANAAGTTGTPSATSDSTESGATTMAADDHTHDITLSAFNSADITPSYENYILAEYTGASGISIGGSLYSDEGSTKITAAAKTIVLWVNGNPNACGGGACTAETASGDYTISNVTASSGDVITVFVDNETEEATTVFKSDGTAQTDVNLYQNRVIVRNDTGASITNTNLESGDRDAGDDDIKFDVSSSNLTVDSNFELHIWTGDTYDPGGTVTTQGTGNLHVEGTAYLDTATSIIGNNIVIESGATLNIQQSTTVTGGAAGGIATAGTLNITGGTVTIGNGTDEDLSITAGATTISGGTVNVKDDVLLSGGTLDITTTVNINGNSGSLFNITGGTYTIDTGGAVTISSVFQVLGATAVANLAGGTTTGSNHFYFNQGTINLSGGNHYTGTNSYLYLANSSGTTTTFNMTGGDAYTAALLVSSQGTLVTTTVTGGTIHIGQGLATNYYYDIQSNAHAFFNIQLEKDTQFHSSSTADMTLNGSLIMDSGITFTGNSKNIIIDNDGNGNGNWTNNGGTYTAGTGTVSMYGGAINGTADTTFYNLTIGSASYNRTISVSNADDPTVTNALTVASGDVLSIGSSRSVTHSGASDTSISGTISGSGRIIYPNGAGGPGTGGTLSAITRFDASSGAVASTTVDARTYGGTVEFYSNSGLNYSAGMASGTYTFSSHYYVIADGSGNMSVLANSGNPTVNISGNLDFTGTGGGAEYIYSGSGTWYVDGDVDFQNGTYSADAGNTLRFDDGGSHNFYPNNTTLQNFTVETFGTTISQLGQDLTIAGTLTINSIAQISVETGLNLTVLSGATPASSGIIAGAGTYVHRPATLPGNLVLSIDNIVIDAVDNSIVIDGIAGTRNLGNEVTDSVVLYNGSGSTRTITLGDTAGRDIRFMGSVTTNPAGGGVLTVTSNTYDPTVTIDSNLTIAASSIWQASNVSSLTLNGNYTNNGTFTDNLGTVILSGTSKQTLSGSMTGTSDFRNLTITNTSGSYSGCATSFTPSVDFAAGATISGAYTITTAGVKVEYNSGSTYTVSGSINWSGSSGNEIIFRNSNLTSGTWLLSAPATQTAVSYVDVARSDASSGTTVDASDGTNINCGTNTNWTFAINISGTANGNNGSTVKVAINGSVQAQTTTISSGTWQISTVSQPTAGARVTVWVDNVADAAESTAVTLYDGTSSISGMVLDTNVLTVGSDDNATLDLNDFQLYDNNDDEDVMHAAPIGLNTTTLYVDYDNVYPLEALTILAGNTLQLESVGTGGEVPSISDEELYTGNMNIYGTLEVLDTGNRETKIYVSGSWYTDSGGTFNDGDSLIIMTSSSAGRTFNNDNDAIDSIQFNSASGGWSFTNGTSITGNMTVTAGTVSVSSAIGVAGNIAADGGTLQGGSNITVNGNFTGNGTVSLSGGTVTFPLTNSIGGNTDWTFNNIATTHGGGCGTKITTATGSGSFTINGTMTTAYCFVTEGYNHSIDPGDKLWIITGTGQPMDAILSNVVSGSSIFRYTGSGSAVTVDANSYANLQLQPNPAVATTYNLQDTLSYNIYSSMTISSSVSLSPGTSTVNSIGATTTFDLDGETLYNFTVVGATSRTATLANTDFSVSNLIDVDTGDTLTIPSGRSVTSVSTASITLDGTINGAGRLIYQSSAAFPTGGTLSAITRFDPVSNNLIMTGRTYGGEVEWYLAAATTVDRTITLGSGAGQTITLSADLTAYNADSDNTLTVTGNTYDPDVTIAGNINSSVAASVGMTLNPGAGTWQVAGTPDLRYLHYVAETGNIFILNGGSVTFYTSYEVVSSTWATFYDFQTSGSGTKTAGASARIYADNDVLIGNGTTLSTSTVVQVNGGDLTTTGGTGTGVLSGSGLVYVYGTGNFGGNANWTMSTLTFREDGADVTTTATGSGSVTVTSQLSLEGSYDVNCDCFYLHDLNAASKTWILSGSANPFVVYTVVNFNYQTSVVRYTGTGATNIARVDYYDLQLRPASGTQTYTLPNVGGGTLDIHHDLSIGGAGASLTLNGDTNDPNLIVTNDVSCPATTGTTTVNTGTTTWTVSGNVNLTDCDGWTAQTGHTLEMNGTSKTLTSDTESLVNFDVTGGSVASADAMDVNGTFDVTSGSFTQHASSNLNVAGNFTLANGTTFTESTSGLLVLDGDLTYTDSTSPKQDVGDVHVGTSPDTTNLSSDMTARSLTINDGDILYTNGYDLDIGVGGITVAADAGAGGGTLDVNDDVETDGTVMATDGKFDLQSGATLANSGGTNVGSTLQFTISSSAISNVTSDLITVGTGNPYDLVVDDGGGTYTLTVEAEDALTVDHDITITGGVLDAKSGENNTINVAGDWTNNDTFTARSGTVNFTGADSSTQILSGSTSFYNFAASTAANTTGRTLRFTAGTTQTVTGTWTITGYSGKVITLQSSTTSAWTINPTAASVTYVSVSYSTNSGTSFCATYSTNGGNNTNWNISGTASCGIDISGQIYTDEGSSLLNCSTTRTVHIRVNGAGTQTTECSNVPANGSYSFTGVTANSGDVVTVYLDNETEEATTVMVSDGTAQTDLDMYQNWVIVRHDTGSSITNTNLSNGDDGDDDVKYSVSAGAATIDAGFGLHIWGGDTYAPGGTLTTTSTATAAGTAGDVHIPTGSTLTVGANNFTVGGDYDNDGTLTTSGLTTFDATSTGFTIQPGSSNFSSLTLSGNGGGNGTWTLQTSDTTVTGTLTVDAGDTLTIDSGRILSNTGSSDISGTGTINGAGRLRFTHTSGGPGTTATINSIVRYDPSPVISIPSTTFDARTYGNDVEFYNNSGGRSVTAASGTYVISGDLIQTCVACGGLTGDFNTNDPDVTIAGGVSIASNSTLSAPPTGTFSVGGNWANSGNFTDNGGTVTLNGTGQQTLSGQMTGASDDFSNLIVTNAGVTDPDIIFSAGADVTGTFTASTASSQLQFLAGGTYTFNNVVLNGQAEGTRVYLRSSSTGTQWNLVSAGTQSVSNTNVRDSNACGGDTIDATDGTNFDATHNDCWDFNTITFTISDTSIGFGTLSATATRYATGDGTGSGTETEAHTLVAATNADNGYSIMINGNTLTNGLSDTIDYIGGSNTAPSTGTEQFGIRLTASGGSGTVSAPYAAAGFAYDLLNFPDIIASSPGPSTATTYSIRYMSNISSLTEPGSYSADMTYVMIPNF